LFGKEVKHKQEFGEHRTVSSFISTEKINKEESMELLKNLRNVLNAKMSALIMAGTMVVACSSVSLADMEQPYLKNGKWLTGDFHQHTTYTDGSNPIATVMDKNNEFGLDWWANSEHGGGFTRDAYGPILMDGFDTGEYARFWDDTSVYPAGTILGDVSLSGGNQKMWRWQSIRDFSFPDVLEARRLYPENMIIQGLEWNVPGHEHGSTAIITGQFEGSPNANVMAEFEYKFDGSDTDITGGASQGWTKSALSGHAKAVEAAAWMQENYPSASWIVPAHPERRATYRIEHFRDMNNAAPDVAFGFESIPGHQKEGSRGSYGTGAVGKGTYGGAGIFVAKVGGLWDAMLGESRRWWVFANSDFHDLDGDFWPGEYQKTYTFVVDENRDGMHSAQEILNGLRSGNSYCVHGDLINALRFSVSSSSDTATMGQELILDKKEKVKIKIQFKSPQMNNNGDPVMVDHIDLISGEVTGFVAPGSADYTKDVNETTSVIATFTSADWEMDEDGWYTVVYHIKNPWKNMYFRLRGTNVASDTKCETDSAGNPLLDRADADLNPDCTDFFATNDKADEAWRDLWFYSNPIFVKVR
jgi:hypothetical protein